MKNKYKDTLKIAYSEFPMRANLLIQQKNIINYWNEKKINQQIISKKQKKKFVMHDGPAYANGELHMGHLLNKILKDIVVRHKQQSQYMVENITGHDCHGLPIYLKASVDKNDHVSEARKKCHEYADKWIEKQRSTMNNMGVLIDEEFYATHNKVEEIYGVLNDLILDNKVFHHRYPMLWCPKTQGVIADVDVEYKDIVSNTVSVKLKILNGKYTGKNIVIWTTTPWSLFDNVAVAYNKDFSYILIEDNFFCVDLCDKELVYKYKNNLVSGDVFKGLECAQPITGVAVPMLHSEIVTKDVGTGFVHIAPAHGPQDYQLAQKHQIPLIDHISKDGKIEHPVVGSIEMGDFESIKKILGDKLLDHGQITHSYPHSSRSKSPLFYRADGQIFLDIKSVDPEQVKKSIESIKLYPDFVAERFQNYMLGREHWCISRNRSWGTPLAIYLHKETKEILKNPKLQKAIVDQIKTDKEIFFDYEKSMDLLKTVVDDYYNYEYYMGVLDVWFDAACVSQLSFLENKTGMYLEGLDQIRGWFQVSSWIGLLRKNQIPFNELVMHGFVVDEHKRKLSKSLGNARSAQEIIDENGIEILRLWVMKSNYGDSKIPIGEAILTEAKNVYRILRNTMRYIISVVETYKYQKTKMLYKHQIIWDYFCHKAEVFNEYMNKYEFARGLQVFYDLLSFLSSTSFNAMKNILYCGDENSEEHKSIVSLFYNILQGSLKILTVILPITSEEIFQYINTKLQGLQGFNGDSVHLNDYIIPKSTGIYKDVEMIKPVIEEINKQTSVLLSDKSINRSSQCSLDVVNESIKTIISAFINIRYINIGPFTKVFVSKEALCSRCFHIMDCNIDLSEELCVTCTKVVKK